MWFALFDYEFPKAVFLKDPSKYQLGLNHSCFGTKVFWFWVVYGGIQACVIYYFVFYLIELNSNNIDASGTMVLGGVILMVNLQILLRSNIFDLIGVFLPIMSVLAYFFFCFIMNLKFYSSDMLLGIFTH